MHIFIRVFAGIVSTFTCTVVVERLVARLMPKFQKKEAADEQKAKTAQTVQFAKRFIVGYLIGTAVTNLTLVAIVVLMFFPKALEVLDLTEPTLILFVSFFGAASVFLDIMLIVFSVKAQYDDEKIIVKRAFRKTREFYYKDILHYTKSGNLKVQTTQGNFLLFNACAGTNTLRGIIAEKMQNRT